MSSLMKSVPLLGAIAFAVSACGYTTVYEPYAGTTPDMPLAQAEDMCENMAKLAEHRAESAYDAANPTPTTGGFWAGFANGGSRNLKGDEAYDATFDGCMAEQGYRRTRVKRSELAQAGNQQEAPGSSRKSDADFDGDASRYNLRSNLTVYPKSYSGDGEWENDDRMPTPDEGYAALGLLLGPRVWVASPLVGHPFSVPMAAYPEGPTPGVVEGSLIDDELYWARLPKGMAPKATEVCTEDPRDMAGEHVLFLFTRGMHLGWRISRIETVLTNEEGRTYILLDAEKVAESIGSPLITSEACIVGFIGDSQLQKSLTSVVGRSITDILEAIEKAKGTS